MRRNLEILRTKKDYLKEISYYLSELVSLATEVRNLKAKQMRLNHIPQTCCGRDVDETRSAEPSPAEAGTERKLWCKKCCGYRSERHVKKHGG